MEQEACCRGYPCNIPYAAPNANLQIGCQKRPHPQVLLGCVKRAAFPLVTVIICERLHQKTHR
jgi:hypothetical protein